MEDYQKQQPSEAATINLPALYHIRRNIRLQRQANQQLPSPANREDIPELPLQYQRSYANEQFFIFDSGQGDADRIFIFGWNKPKSPTIFTVTKLVW